VRRIAHERNAGVILCSHLLSEIEGVCDDVVILNLGHLVARGSVAEVISRVQHNIILKGAVRVQVLAEAVEEALRVVQDMPNIHKITQIGEVKGWLRLELVPPNNGDIAKAYEINNRILSVLIRNKIPILAFEVEGGKLQDVFLHLTEEVIV
jgi:ABC-type multidrug transport system ATPase subunit